MRWEVLEWEEYVRRARSIPIDPLQASLRVLPIYDDRQTML